MDNVATHEDWKTVFSELAPGLVLFARQWVRTSADAEDIVQEAFVKFWRRDHKIDNPETIGARELFRSRGLLYATVRTVALDHIRRDSRRARREVAAFADVDQTVEPQFRAEDESQHALASAIDRLPHEQREVVVMKVWNELTFAEIAEVVGVSQNTAASRYRYALAALKKDLLPQ